MELLKREREKDPAHSTGNKKTGKRERQEWEGGNEWRQEAQEWEGGTPCWKREQGMGGRGAASEFFTFQPLFRKFLTNRPLAERIQKMDPSSAPPMLVPSSAPASLAPSPWARANLHGRKLGASHSGAKLGAVDAGAEHVKMDI